MGLEVDGCWLVCCVSNAGFHVSGSDFLVTDNFGDTDGLMMVNCFIELML